VLVILVEFPTGAPDGVAVVVLEMLATVLVVLDAIPAEVVVIDVLPTRVVVFCALPAGVVVLGEFPARVVVSDAFPAGVVVLDEFPAEVVPDEVSFNVLPPERELATVVVMDGPT